MQLQRGMRDKLDKYLNLHDTFEAEMTVDGSGEYDFCCFGVDTADKLSDDQYMIFYNQTASPQRKIQFQMSGTSSKFLVNLSKLPQQIQKLIFTVSIDGNSVMDDIRSFVFSVKQGGSELLRLQVSGIDFKAEKAIISVEVYRKDTWRINAVARGFNGGLGDLLRTYGGEEAAPTQSPRVTFSTC
ncbi:MAG: TerD family protein [Ruminococcus sp.]|nr:TerD family protein [Ruminococcus sp.]